MTTFAQCLGAGQRFCADCRRNVDNNPPESRGEHQVYVGATTNSRCAHWLAMPPKPRGAQETAV
jgi:hypothetical protein